MQILTRLILSGDGVGPGVMAEGTRIIDVCDARRGSRFDIFERGRPT